MKDGMKSEPDPDLLRISTSAFQADTALWNFPTTWGTPHIAILKDERNEKETNCLGIPMIRTLCESVVDYPLFLKLKVCELENHHLEWANQL